MTQLDVIQAATAAAFCRRCGDECGAERWEAEALLRSDILYRISNAIDRADHEDGHVHPL